MADVESVGVGEHLCDGRQLLDVVVCEVYSQYLAFVDGGASVAER